MTDVVGLDLSLTRPGIADASGAWSIKVPPMGRTERLIWIRDHVVRVVRNAALVVLEGYAYGVKASHAHALGELGGLVRVALWEHDVRVAIAPPASRARYATGKGGAAKALVVSEWTHRRGLVFSDDNAVDADVLRCMGLDWLGQPVIAVPAAHRAALAGVEWPEVVS